MAVVAASGADRLALASHARVDLGWVDSDAELMATLRAMALPAGEGFAWFAGEAATAKQVRALLLEEKGLAKEAMRVSAYWKQGVADHHENLE
jgi:NADPH-dependent ferric siderophore reductase